MGAPIVHFEIGCKDRKKTAEFYGKLFDWKFESYGDMPMLEPQGGANSIGGHINSLGHEPHQYVTIYAEVDDITKYLDKAGKLGGRTIVPATEVPQMGQFAWLADPEGNVIGLWKPMQ
ncbi:MAG: VOC family protein [Phycisphaerales bacterium]|nr:VOC family protein [Phycisphaerales bacterium]